MRDLIFKNLTSLDRKRKIISSREIADNDGLRSVIQRHFIAIIREVKDAASLQELPCVHVLKEHNNREQRGRFLCRIKGCAYFKTEERRFVIFFMHSLKITLNPIPQGITPT